jgi:hypothetical protein
MHSAKRKSGSVSALSAYSGSSYNSGHGASGSAMAEIYGLYSGRDGKVRYVGETLGSREDRFKWHQRSQINRFITRVYTWIHQEWRAGFPVESAVLDRCSNEGRARFDLETEWISKFPDLLNERKRGYGWHGRKPPDIPEIKEYMARFGFNSGGFRGVHFWRGLDRYSVFVYTGRDWKWLPGDGTPGWAGDIWFSDRIDALKARDEHRQGRRGLWLPDIEKEA